MRSKDGYTRATALGASQPESTTALPQISVVIPVWNGEDQICMCLDALAVQTLPRDMFEVVVVDNGSTDRTTDVVGRYPFVQVIVEAEPGSYQARNAGLAHVKGCYVAFTDADCVPEPDWLETALLAVKRHPGAAILAGRVELFRMHREDSETCETYERLFALNQELYTRYGVCVTANWISPVEVLRRVGGFDGRLKAGGDFEMSRRITKAGHSLVYCPDVTVRHPIRGRVKEILTKSTRTVGGRWTRDKTQLSAFKFGLNIITDGARKLRTILREGPPNTWLKLKVSGLLALVVLSSLCEYVRLLFSGEPRRA